MKELLKLQVNVWLAVVLVIFQTCLSLYLLRERQAEILQLNRELVHLNQLYQQSTQ